jgi:hypothetical protein
VLLRVNYFHQQSTLFGYIPFYDEAVHYSLAKAILNGAHLYTDQLFLHPPTILTIFMPIAALSNVFPALFTDSFAVQTMSVLTCFIGGVNTYLIYKVATKKHLCSKALAFFSALLYAIIPICVQTDTKAIIEPYLILFLLLFLLNFPKKRAAIFLGVACTLKIWAVPLLIAVIIYILTQKQTKTQSKHQFKTALIFLSTACITAFILLAPYFFGNHNFIGDNGVISAFFKEALIDQASVTSASVPLPQKLLAALIALMWFALFFYFHKTSRFQKRKPLFQNQTFLLVASFTGLALFMILSSRLYWHYWDFLIPFALLFLFSILQTLLNHQLFPKAFKGFSSLILICFIALNLYNANCIPEPDGYTQPFRISYQKQTSAMQTQHTELISFINSALSTQTNSSTSSPCVWSTADVLVLTNALSQNIKNSCQIQGDIFGQFINSQPASLSENMYYSLPSFAWQSNAKLVLAAQELESFFDSDSVFKSKYSRVKLLDNIIVYQKNSY